MRFDPRVLFCAISAAKSSANIVYGQLDVVLLAETIRPFLLRYQRKRLQTWRITMGNINLITHKLLDSFHRITRLGSLCQQTPMTLSSYSLLFLKSYDYPPSYLLSFVQNTLSFHINEYPWTILASLVSIRIIKSMLSWTFLCNFF